MIELSSDMSAKLTRLADEARQTPAQLASDAVTSFVSRQTEIVSGIRRGFADVEAGRVVPHDDAMAEIDALIERTVSDRQA